MLPFLNITPTRRLDFIRKTYPLGDYGLLYLYLIPTQRQAEVENPTHLGGTYRHMVYGSAPPGLWQTLWKPHVSL